ncbi:MAG: threonylcarbamoyl-AMP synthase [Bacteroidales bacterium]|jgi:L-threonylcarbamoyladenylate synthase|nr:threonylcarbamoyl-AMP synthase [Bacteroidales bacterium]
MMEEEIKKCKDLLKQGKILLYPSDTIWGIGADATNAEAIDKVYKIKGRSELKSMLILIDKADRLPLYVKQIPLIAWDLLSHTYRPTTFVYPTAQNLPPNLVNADGSVAIRIVNNLFCKKLITALGKPIVSTSANISGQDFPQTFLDISQEIMNKVDYIVPEQYSESTDYKPSRIIKFVDNYNFVVIRE